MKRCSFFNTYGISGEKPLATAGFVRIYCRESRQGECMRKVLSLVLGGPEKVPANMILNGLVMSGTTPLTIGQKKRRRCGERPARAQKDRYTLPIIQRLVMLCPSGRFLTSMKKR